MNMLYCTKLRLCSWTWTPICLWLILAERWNGPFLRSLRFWFYYDFRLDLLWFWSPLHVWTLPLARNNCRRPFSHLYCFLHCVVTIQVEINYSKGMRQNVFLLLAIITSCWSICRSFLHCLDVRIVLLNSLSRHEGPRLLEYRSVMFIQVNLISLRCFKLSSFW